eukprot:12140612-Alexandrium_andersonii.AAC.1
MSLDANGGTLNVSGAQRPLFAVSACSLRPVLVASGLCDVSGLLANNSQGFAFESAAPRALRPVFVVSGCVRRHAGVWGSVWE